MPLAVATRMQGCVRRIWIQDLPYRIRLQTSKLCHESLHSMSCGPQISLPEHSPVECYVRLFENHTQLNFLCHEHNSPTSTFSLRLGGVSRNHGQTIFSLFVKIIAKGTPSAPRYVDFLHDQEFASRQQTTFLSGGLVTIAFFLTRNSTHSNTK